MSTSRPGTIRLVFRLWRHLTRRRRRQFAILAGLMLFSALAEVVSLGAVLPFLFILTAPEQVFKYPLVARLAEFWGITRGEELVLPLTVAFIIVAVAAAAIRILLLWTNTRVAYASGGDLSCEVYRRTLYQPYSVHMRRNSSEVISGISIKVAGSVNVLLALLTLCSSAVLLVAVMSALIAINPMVALKATLGFGGAYAAITMMNRRRLRRNSEAIAYDQTQVIKALQEGLGGIRDVLLDGTQPVYCQVYGQSDRRLRLAQGGNAFASSMPRHAMEAFGMVFIAVLAFALSRAPGGLATALPVLGALALGAQRLLPAMQQGYSAWATIAGSHASLADTIELLDQPLPAEALEPEPGALSFEDSIRFASVRFRYNADGPWVIDGLNLTIPKGARVGFVGSTGSGKSTTLDLLMGLLTPDEGEVLVDGEPLRGDRIRSWQRTIAHVPQSIFLADITIAENIALGVERAAIDMERVREAARQAQIADFIEGGPLGYDAVVGERGIRLSGGQRQRIGIARALYRQARVLVFDEATSALDNATERAVIDAIEALNPDLTILIIAHRLSTVQRCDIVVEMERGAVVAQGTHEALLERSSSFRHMVTAAK